MSINTTFWLAIDSDGDETIFEDEPERNYSLENETWFEPKYLTEGVVSLPKGQIKAWGYKLKRGECMEVVGPNYDPPRDIPQQ